MSKIIVPERRIFIPRGPSFYRQRGFMRLIPSLGAWPNAAQRVMGAVEFDPTTDYMSRSSALSASNSRVATISFWFRPNSGSQVNPLFMENGGAFSAFYCIFSAANGGWVFEAYDASNIGIFFWSSSLSTVTFGAWNHVLISWDIAANLYQIYVNDVNRFFSGSTTANFPVEWANGITWKIGICSTALNSLAGMYLNTEVRLDLSTTANRRKFNDGTGRPVYLGRNGEIPTGSKPTVYLNIERGEPVANFGVNLGTGGNYSLTGTPVVAATSPSP